VIIDVSNILKAEGSRIDINDTLELKNMEFNGDYYQFNGPIKVVGSILNIGNVLRLNADVKAEIIVQCYRCNKEMVESISFPLEEALVKNNAATITDEDAVRFDGNRIDLSEVIVSNIILNMSMKYLCSQECKGLCPKCGVDLNTNQCDCQEETIDPRLEILKKLL